VSALHSSEEAADWADECREWIDALAAVRRVHGTARTSELLGKVLDAAIADGMPAQLALNTPYRNTLSVAAQPRYPGNVELEAQLESVIRWNAMAMVLQASDCGAGLGGHIATYASAATLFEVGFNHFFRNRSASYGGDIVNLQPHAAPGVYARAFLEGRLTQQQLQNFRRELAAGGGLSSYPHPRRMPDFWPCPTASMGLSTAISIYLARFRSYLRNRGLLTDVGGKVWCFIGDGEADEPEVLGTLPFAAREGLEDLIVVVNCNLQRLDGPVRGSGKIIQELERQFHGAGWRVLKVVWGSEWDALLARDENHVLQRRMDDAVDGDYQLYSTLPGGDVRAHWVRGDRELDELMKTLTDEQIRSIRRGGHDPVKVYAAYASAVRGDGRPTVVLAKTIKGFAMGTSAEGRNAAHQKKTLTGEERVACARRLGVPLDEEAIRRADFYLPPANSALLGYLHNRRGQLGGFQPTRNSACPPLPLPPNDTFQESLAGSSREISTTMALVRLLTRLMRDPQLGRLVVPIVPDEARTFGMDGLFRQFGIYASSGQRYRPVDADALTSYSERANGQILQEGICEAGAMASFIAAGTAYSHFGVPAIPFYIFYSMFGFQRVGDLIWAAADNLCRGFLIGATAGRTTLNGEGLQHQDGHSHLIANTVPSVVSYDPAFAYELAVIVRDGLRRMYVEQQDVFYYITAYNENYPHPALPEGAEDGIVRGLYRIREAPGPVAARVHLLGSGPLLRETIAAQTLLQNRGIAADVWSVTSYSELYRDAIECDRWNRAHPSLPARQPYVQRALAGAEGVFVAVTDFMKAMPAMIAAWLPGTLIALGTDGFGLSDSRAALRAHFEVDAEHIAHAAADALERRSR
jgi:pyruvate dehydrogenase E1 component